MRTLKTLVIVMFLLLNLNLYAQDDELYIRTKKRQGFVSAGGMTLTANIGGVGVSNQFPTDSGNQDFIFDSVTVTPASMISPSWGANCLVYWSAVDATNPNWGCGIYDDASASGQVTTSGATVTWSSGQQFDTTHWGAGATVHICSGSTAPYYITTCTNNIISTVTDATHITMTATVTPSCASACFYSIIIAGDKKCTAFSSTVATANAWNSLALSGCGTPQSNHIYHITSITDSGTQQTFRSGNSLCAGLGTTTQIWTLSQGWHAYQLPGRFTSNGNWPANFSAANAASFDGGGDGCIAAYVPITYTTLSRYQKVTHTTIVCDTIQLFCDGETPNIQANHTVVIASLVASSSGAVPTGAVTTTNGVTTDTLTQRGTCAQVGGHSEICFYEIDRATAGANGIKCTYNQNPSGEKFTCALLELAGTQSSSFDQVNYDTVATVWPAGNPFTGNSITTTVANEYVYAIGMNLNTQGCCAPYTGNFFLLNDSGWSIFQSNYAAGNAVPVFGWYEQVVTNTGTFAPTGAISAPTGSYTFITGIISLK